MCGIVGGYTSTVTLGVQALRHRGPDAEGCIQCGPLWLGHTRLAILDLDVRSNQPFTYHHVTLSYNGELWNYRMLRDELIQAGYTFMTTGDTEVVAAALAAWGTAALPRFDGMFALAWTKDGSSVHLARDRYGECPLHVAAQRPFLFASERKALLAMGAHPRSIQDVLPGHVATATADGWQQTRYHVDGLSPLSMPRDVAAAHVHAALTDGCVQRSMSDVPVCTLLSGGIDSAAVAWGIRPAYGTLVAYTAVHDPKSRDVRCARQVATALGIELREVSVPLPTCDDLAEVIWHIEQPHKAQVEIGWACLCLARQMQRDGFKVTFSGEGSDELWAAYGFSYHALLSQDWHTYRHDLFLMQHRKNFARCNKIFLAYGVECRLPFLHPSLVAFALRLPRATVQDGNRRPKAVLQEAFRGILPAEIVDRPKVAFQDGLGLKAAIAQRIPNPERFYHAEYARQFGAAAHQPRPYARGEVGVRR